MNVAFIQDLKRAASSDDVLLFVRRSGGRSLAAARAAKEAGLDNHIPYEVVLKVRSMRKGIEGTSRVEVRRPAVATTIAQRLPEMRSGRV